MTRHRLRALWLVPLMLLPLVAGPSSAGIIFGRKNKKPTPTPTERVPELLAIVKNDGDKSKRAAAAQELRQYDPVQFPMIQPMLIDVLLTDKESSVRAEAAQSLGKLRPVSQQAGMALEQAQSGDSSRWVRLQARSSLLQYHWNGYRGGSKKDELGPNQTKEPPLAPDQTPPVISTTTGRIAPQPTPGPRTMSSYRPVPVPPAPFPPVSVPPTTKEPPLAPVSSPAQSAPVSPVPPPAAGGNESGPDLTPP